MSKISHNFNKKVRNSCNNSTNEDSTITMTISQFDYVSDENISDAENNVEAISLHSILDDIKSKLSLLMANEGISLSLDDIEKVVETRKVIFFFSI